MKDGQYYSISGWMGKYLGLRANDLICFAVIYGFSMDGESQFKGNLDYLSSCMFASRPTVLLSLKHLIEHNLILKHDDVVNGKKRCYYSTNVIYDEGDFDVQDTSKEPLSMTSKEPLPKTSKGSLPKEYNNKEDNKKESKDSKKEELFENFWSKYRKGSKQKARDKWNGLKDKEKEKAIATVDDYLTYCRRSNRPLKDVSVYLNQKCFNDDWNVIPDYYTVRPTDDDRRKKFKEWICSTYPDLIYHRNPLTFEQAVELYDTYTVGIVNKAMEKLSLIDVHQYFNIKSGLEKILESGEID